MFEKIFAQTSIMKKGLDGLWLKNQVVSNNIANAETPDYKAKEVNTEEAFRDALFGKGNVNPDSVIAKNLDTEKRVEKINFDVGEQKGLEINASGNNVDLDKEMTELAKNQIMYNAMVQRISKELSRIKYAIDEGGQ